MTCKDCGQPIVEGQCVQLKGAETTHAKTEKGECDTRVKES